MEENNINTINRKGHSYLCCSECLVGYHKVNDDDNDETPRTTNNYDTPPLNKEQEHPNTDK